MTNVLILGASGQIARNAIAMLAGENDARLTLFARNTARLAEVPANASVVQGEVLDGAKLREAVRGQDIVYANLTGEDLDALAKASSRQWRKASNA